MSGQLNQQDYDLASVTDSAKASGVEHGDLLLAFADAAMGEDSQLLSQARQALVEALGRDGMLAAAGIIATFNQMVRIADGTGIPLDSVIETATEDFRETIGLEAFGSAANHHGKKT